jgi:hypothetical protein
MVEVIEPRYLLTFVMVDGFCSPEDNMECCVYGQRHATSPGSKSMACIHSEHVNVGGPGGSATDGSIGEQARWVRTSRRRSGSQMGHSTDESW